MKLEDCFKLGLLKKTESDMESALNSMETAKDSLKDADKNLKIVCYNVVIMLSYISMFHSARALLFKDGIKERTHVCIPIYLKETYPNFEKYANTLDSYRLFRHRVVYGLRIMVDKEDAEEAIKSAKEFLAVSIFRC